MKEYAIHELQKAISSEWRGGVLSNWISIIKSKFPEAEAINYYGSKQGRINGILYDFFENEMYNGAPRIVRIPTKFNP